MLAPNEMKVALIDRLAELLTDSDSPENDQQEIETLLLDANLNYPSTRKPPKAFAEEVFELNPSLVEMAARKQLDPEDAENPQDLILRLLPSDGHLE